MLDKVILDADFCIKLGRFEKLPILYDVLPLVARKIYIHKYVYENEILMPQTARKQIGLLIDEGKAELLDDYSFNPADKAVFIATRDTLKRAMVGTVENQKNWGEVLSLATAKTLGITIFMSDEGKLKSIIDRLLNAGTDHDINVFRIIDLVHWIKDHTEAGINRKTAKAVWLTAGKGKESFSDIWPPG